MRTLSFWRCWPRASAALGFVGLAMFSNGASATCTLEDTTYTCSGETTTTQHIDEGDDVNVDVSGDTWFHRSTLYGRFFNIRDAGEAPGHVTITFADGAVVENEYVGAANEYPWPLIYLGSGVDSVEVIVESGALLSSNAVSSWGGILETSGNVGHVTFRVDEGGVVRTAGGGMLRAGGNPEPLNVSVFNSGLIERLGSEEDVYFATINQSIWGAADVSETMELYNYATGVLRNNVGLNPDENEDWGFATSTVIAQVGWDSILVNEGLIENLGEGYAFASNHENFGTVLTNSGRIASAGEVAIFMGNGNDTLILQTGSEVIGAIDGGERAVRPDGTLVGDDIDELILEGFGSEDDEIRNFELLSVNAGGIWSLDGNAAFEDVYVNTGDLRVNGEVTVSGTLNIAGGARLGGDGVLSGGMSVAFADGAVIAPGNSIGVLTVTGDVEFGAGSTVEVELNDQGEADLLVVDGAVTIAEGSVMQIFAELGDYPYLAPTYEVISANAISGEFSTLEDNLPDLTFVASYTPTGVQLTYLQDTTAEAFLSPKEVFGSSVAGARRADYLFAETVRDHGRVMLGGSTHAGILENASRTDLTRGAAADGELEFGLWTSLVGATTDVDDDGFTPGWEADTSGVILGVEGRVSQLLFGLAAGRTTTTLHTGYADSEIEAYHVGAHVAARKGRLDFSGMIGYDRQDYEIGRRIMSLDGQYRTAFGDTDGESVVGSLELFYDWSEVEREGLRYGPTFTLSANDVQMDRYTETGAGVLNLNVRETQSDQMVAGLGLDVQFYSELGARSSLVNLSLGWERILGDSSVDARSFIGLVNSSYDSRSADAGRDALAAGLNVSVALSESTSLQLRYDGTFMSGYSDHRGGVGFTAWF